MRILTEKPSYGQIARRHRPTREQVFEAVMKSPVAQIARASAEPDAEIFCDESPSPITSVDLEQIQRLARFLPVIVLIPRPKAADQAAAHRISAAESSSEPSATTTLLCVLGKAVQRFKRPTPENAVHVGDATVAFSA